MSTDSIHNNTEDIDLSISEFYAIARELEQYHSVFYQFWEIGKPIFSDIIDTACVCFDEKGNCINFIFNPTFWKSLTSIKRNFIICHECLHVILRHGLRSKDCVNKDIANIAMDIVINHMLTNQFGFLQNDVDPEKKYCWLDTIFKYPQRINKDKNFEYYYTQMLDKSVPNNLLISKSILVDIHDFLDDSKIDDLLNKMGQSLTNEEKQKLQNSIKSEIPADKKDNKSKDQQAGTSALGNWLSVDNVKPVIKRKWETIITNWAKKFLPNDFDTYEHWARVNRRLIEIPDDALLPTEMELQEKEEDGKILVFFFLDMSGSCSHLASRFWKVAHSLPKHRFDKKLFSFDTRVYAVTEEDEKKQRLRGGGGTGFCCIENAVQKEIGAGKKSNVCIFVITDGYSYDYIKPKHPEIYKWFLTAGGSRRHIPKESKIYSLSDFE